MAITLVYDVYGTLIDTDGIVKKLKGRAGWNWKAKRFTQLWLDKQLEYSFRRGLMRDYLDFKTCTLQALDYACDATGYKLDNEFRLQLMAEYNNLPSFNDVRPSLDELREAGCKQVVLSNGSVKSVKKLLKQNDLKCFISDIISADEINTFKPNPDIYHLLLSRLQTDPRETWLVSSNSFDVIGAIAAGIRAVWVKRDRKAVFDTWGYMPDITVNSLIELTDMLR